MQRFEGPTIGQRMAIGFGTLLLIIGTLLVAVYAWQRQSNEALHNFTQVSRPTTDASKDLESAVLRIGVTLRSYLLEPESAQLSAYERAANTFSVELRRLRALIQDADDRAIFERVEAALQSYMSGVRHLINRRGAGPVDSDAELTIGTVRESALAMLRDFVDLQIQRTDRALADMERAQQRVSQGVLIAGVLACAFFVLFGWLIAHSIRKPTQALVAIAAALQTGNWKPALALAAPARDARALRAQNNELAQIGRAFGSAAVVLERREQRLSADRNVAGASAASLDRTEIAAKVLHAMAEYMRAEVAVAYLFDDDAGGDAPLLPIAAYGLATAPPAVAYGDGVPGQAIRDRKLVRVRDIPPDSAFRIKLGYDAAPPREVAALPICFGPKALGAVLVASLRPFDDEALDFLESAALQLGVGLNNVLTHAQVQRLLSEVAQKSQQIQAQSEEVQAQNEELQAQGEEIRAQNEQLAEQAARLREQSLELSESDRRKNEFLGLLAHELRNPMAGISNGIFVLSRPDLKGEQADNARAVIHRQTRHLSRLIDDLLDITRVSHGKISLKRERLDLVQLLRETLDDHRPAFEAAQIALNVELPDQPVIVSADRVRLCQIVGNLVDNALKFSEKGGSVTVALRVDAAAADRAQLSVIDSGIGIDALAFSRLFEPFSQGDPSITRKNGGLGLGLALVKALVSMHGGSVEAFSEGAHKGARFVVTLPLDAADDADAAPEPERLPAGERPFEVPSAGDPPMSSRSSEGARSSWSAQASFGAPSSGPQSLDGQAYSSMSDALGSSGCRVLIIEDNADAAHSLAAAMRLEGHEVRVAHSAVDGLQIARAFRPDVLLCDIGLPVIDGYEVARRFRSDETLKTVYLVAVTGYAGEQERERATRAGFDRHLAKPPDLKDLTELLANLASRCRSGPDAQA